MTVRTLLSLAVVAGSVASAGLTAAPAAAQTAPAASAADVAFMQGMIPHHGQALEMVALVPGRSESRTLALVAERIRVSQADEIAWMTRWLERHGAEAPDPHGGHAAHGGGHASHAGHGAHAGHGGHALMPGMLTPDEMARLAAATGPEFERRFYFYMIRHHEGALGMVDDLFATPGAAQASEVYRFATDLDADQRAEIARMRELLAAAFPIRP